MLSFNNILFITLTLLTSFNRIFAQQDTSHAQMSLRKFYSTRYLQDVLTKKQFNYKPLNGVVPDSSVAIKIAEAVLSKIYGEDHIIKEKPFTAVLAKDYWIFYGFLPDVYLGGVAEIVIRKSNGEIINISHGK